MSVDCATCAFEYSQTCNRVCVDGSHYKRILQTNADKIRAMNDEELAMLLSTLPRSYPKNGFDPTCKHCWLDWLEQEAT